MKILRITKHCPIDGSSLTKIYKRTCFGWKKIIQYRMGHTEMRTIGFREPHLGLPSVPKEYGDVVGYTYIQKREL
jgi:hypothetical protein